ncbi:MAG: hypothetical protein LBJ39_01175 [Tannerellaceae bacterium]|jgi:hypothetical protein|nr:hypothetical protein [Tannerellaceae bacterium]
MGNKRFNLEEQFQSYLQQVELDKTKLSHVQYTETAKAFAAGVSQLMMYFYTVVGVAKDESESIEMLEDIIQQIKEYWKVYMEKRLPWKNLYKSQKKPWTRMKTCGAFY